MAIEFREIRRGELDDALEGARAGGVAVQPDQVASRLSVIACDKGKAMGNALSHRDPAGGRGLVVELRKGAKPALARDLVDRALRKANARGIATLRVSVTDAAAADLLWGKAEWLSSLKPLTPPPA